MANLDIQLVFCFAMLGLIAISMLIGGITMIVHGVRGDSHAAMNERYKRQAARRKNRR